MTAVEILPHDLAVMTALGTIGRPVGFTTSPDGALDALRTQDGPHEYVILYPISGLRDGTLDGEDDEVELVYQTTIVAVLPEGARRLIDQIEAALGEVAIDGRAVVSVRADDTGAVRPDDDVQPPVFFATPRWRLWTSPV